MSVRNQAATASALLVVLSIGGCGDGSNGATQSATDLSPTETTFAEGGAKTTCPAQLTGEPKASTCRLAFEEVPIERCPSGGPGGFDITASGIPCAEARALRLPLGAGPLGKQRAEGSPRATTYRAWIATGPFTDPKPKRPTQWTCLKRFNSTAAEGVRHTCWNESGDSVAFSAG